VTFSELNLNKPLLNALADLEFEYATPIQEKAFPIIMSGRDAVGVAQTGTGKTIAYLLPILRQLPYSDAKDPRVLILVPTRELVIQVVEEINKLTKYASIRTVGVYGGTNVNTQKDIIFKGLDIIVATPGRFIDLTFTGILRLKSIQKVVIDEVDEMLNQGFRKQLRDIMGLLPAKRQNLLFSATLTSDVEELFSEYFNNPVKIEIAPHGTPLEKIVQIGYQVPNFNTKINLLKWLLASNVELNKVLVFVGTKKLADKVYESITTAFPEQIGIIHSNKTQNFRINAIKQFEEGKHRVLIATDIIARGTDIIDVSHVINFDIPEVPGDYIHRIGRTGRAEKAGVAISFISENELSYLMGIEHLMKRTIPVESFPEEVEISKSLIDEEKPDDLFDKNYLKTPSREKLQGAFHEKKGKNQKVNLGGPKQRNPKFGKPAKRPHVAGQVKMTKKSRKTRF
jgi:ATP-dependent RNA helicase RhlE